MAKIRFFRHSLRNGEFISPEGFRLIEDKKDSILQVGKIFVSPHERTIQTAAHMITISKTKKLEIIQLESIGNPKVEEEILSNKGLMEDFSSNPSKNIYALMRKYFGSKELKRLELESSKMVAEIYQEMSEYETVIAIGHSPYIFMANNALSWTHKVNHNMSEMEYLDINI